MQAATNSGISGLSVRASLAARLLWREWRSGELRLIALALVLAVAAVSAVAFFADRLRGSLEREAAQLLGADLLLVADHPWPESLAAEAAKCGLRFAETRVFPSMVQGGGSVQLADLKAVSSNYPLRGELRVAERPGAAGVVSAGGPPAGTVWADERLLAGLGVSIGDELQVGNSRLRLTGLLTHEPDRGANFLGIAPRLMLALDDLPATGLIQNGSRVTYRLLLAGEAAALADFRLWLQARLTRGERLEDLRNARPEIRSALDRAQRFLGLATLLAVVLAAVALALASRRYLERQWDSCAVLRCLGATESQVLRLYAGQFALLAVLAALAGLLLGYLAHLVLSLLLGGLVAGFVATALPAPSWQPLAQGAATAVVLLFGFALPPLLRLRRIPALRVLRREIDGAPPGWLSGQALGVLALAGLMFWVAGDLRLGGLSVAAFGLAALAFVFLARLGIALLSRLRFIPVWRPGLAHLQRHAASNAVQTAALAVGFLAVLLLVVTRGELFSAWERSLPASAPNRFLINIQPQQVAAVGDLLRQSLPDAGSDISLAPMVRGRLQSIAGRAVSAADYPDDERSQRLVEREFNLSWRDSLPEGNRVLAGRWFSPADHGRPLASVEAGLAERLGIRVGDELLFNLAGEMRALQVVGLRELDWDSMRVNFFVLTPPGVLPEEAASHIVSFHLPPAQVGLATELLRRFPNLTLIDLSVVIAQVRQAVGQVAQAVQFIFLFTLLAGALVLHAALLAAFDERRREMAILRALGASRKQLRARLLVEMGAIGGLAGLIAALAADLVAGLLARQIFEIGYRFSWWLPPLATLFGAGLAIAVAGGIMSRLLRTPPGEVLRET